MPKATRDTSLSVALALAACAVGDVLDGASLDAALAANMATKFAPLRPAVQDLCYTALRDHGFLPRLVDALTDRRTPHRVRALLYVAIADLRANPRRAHTIVDQAVDAAARVSGERARGFVNAVLRRYLREKDALDAHAEVADEGRWRHPQWWIDRLRRAWPQDWEAILTASNARAPMTLRVNRRRMSRDAYLARLAADGIDARAVGDSGVIVERPLPVQRVPGFVTGVVSVQDAGAQQAADLLDLGDGMRVLDACAAPGGKSGAILERAAVALTALDSDATRLERVRENLARLGEHADVMTGNAADPSAWWDGVPFDRVLADVPCSASGVVRRHPDIKWLRRAADVAALARIQDAILDALWQVLAAGGKLLYATCSVFPEENSARIDAFLARHAHARRVPLAILPTSGQLLPCSDHDGFFYALLEKPRSPVGVGSCAS